MALRIDGKKGSGALGLVERVAVTGPQDLTGGVIENMFQILGGPIEVLALVGEITEAVSADSCNMKLQLVPTEFYPKDGRVNLCLHSRNFGQGISPDDAWSGYAAGTSQNETDIDGKPNSAWTITDDSGSMTEGLYYKLNISPNNHEVLFSLYVKKDTDVTRFPGFKFKFSGGTDKEYHVQLNTQTGAVVEITDEVTGDVSTDDAGDWWRINLHGTDSGNNTRLDIYIHPANGTVWGVESGAATGSIIIDAAQIELGQSSPTDYIYTEGAAGSYSNPSTEGTLQTGLPYRIFATEADYFFTGCAVDDYFIPTTEITLDENNSAMWYGYGNGDTDLCDVIDIDGFVLNSWIYLDGVVTNPAVQAVPGTALPLGIGMATPLVLQPGNIKMDLSNYDPSTGTITWYMRYLALKRNSYVNAMA